LGVWGGTPCWLGAGPVCIEHDACHDARAVRASGGGGTGGRFGGASG
jgi:hypothetical protein